MLKPKLLKFPDLFKRTITSSNIFIQTNLRINPLTSPSYCQLDNIPSNNTVLKNITQRSVHLIENQPKDEQYLHVDEDRKGARHTQHLVDICFHILEFHSAEIFFSYYL